MDHLEWLVIITKFFDDGNNNFSNDCIKYNDHVLNDFSFDISTDWTFSIFIAMFFIFFLLRCPFFIPAWVFLKLMLGIPSVSFMIEQSFTVAL